MAFLFFKRPCCLVYIVLWVAVSHCCIYVLNDIGNDPFCRSNMNIRVICIDLIFLICFLT